MAQELLYKDIYYVGNFGETIKKEGKYLKYGELFSTGIHRGVTYTKNDIKQLVKEFQPEEGIPVQIDHSESALHTVGWLKEVKAQGEKLIGKLEIIDENAQERIDKGLMRKLSVSFYLKHVGSKLKPYKLREVSLVAFPQVKGAQLFNEQTNIQLYSDLAEKVLMLNKKIDQLTEKSKNDISNYQRQNTSFWRRPYKELEGIKNCNKDEVFRGFGNNINKETKLNKLTPKERIDYQQAEWLKSYMESEKEMLRISENINLEKLEARLKRHEEYAQEEISRMKSRDNNRTKGGDYSV